MPTDSGRKRDPAWDKVLDMTDPKTNFTISAKIERVKAHIGK